MTTNRTASLPGTSTAGQSRAGDLTPHLAHLITGAARRFGARPAFTLALPDGSSEALSFTEVDRLSDAFAGFLTTTLDLNPGDVMAVQLANGLPFPIVVFGAWKAGLIVSPVNPYYTPRETSGQLRDVHARVLVADAAALESGRTGGLLADLDLVLVDGPGVRMTSASSAASATQPCRSGLRCWSFTAALEVQCRPTPVHHHVALYQYTGGTTGRSKAAVITAANLLATRSIVAQFFTDNGSPIAAGTALTALPLYHIFAFLFGMLVYVEAGTNNVIVPVPRPISNLRAAFQNNAIDWMAGVDTLYGGLLAEPWFRANPPRLRFAIAGGAALRPSIAEEWERLVGPLLEGYGLTETTGIVSCNAPTQARRMGSIGIPVPGSEIRIVDTDGTDVAPGTAGELLVRGPQVVAGYLDPRDDSNVFCDGWLRTGDIVKADMHGALTIMDRKKDMILVSGFNVYPNEVEAVISAHPAVLEVGVVGVPNERTGEAVCAFVVLREGVAATREDLDVHCRLSLAGYKVPREFRFHSALPKSAVGKILRNALRTHATDA